jgi:hypothetical protein
MTPLCELALRHRTDKFIRHYYTPIYFLEIPKPLKVKRVLEIGILQGHSLRMWRDFFPFAMIVGIDKDPATMITGEDRIVTYVGDQAKPDEIASLIKGVGPFDLIVDDGSHLPELQALTARTLLPFLAPDGLYSIEDVKRGQNEGEVPVAKDDPMDIIGHLPPGFDARLFRTGIKSDDAMILIRAKKIMGRPKLSLPDTGK